MAEVKKLKLLAKRRLLAQDVLRGLEEKVLSPVSGRYLDKRIPKNVEAMSTLQENLDGVTLPLNFDDVLQYVPAQHCQVCVIGSLVIASLRRYNSCTFRDFETIVDPENTESLFDHLKMYFEEDDLALMEIYFEGWGNSVPEHFTEWKHLERLLDREAYDQFQKAFPVKGYGHRDQFDRPQLENRLRAIMQVVAKKGRFVQKDLWKNP